MHKRYTHEIRFRKLMRICVTQGMIMLMLCGVAIAHDNFAQILDRQVTLSLEHIPLEKALMEIERSTGVRFFYSLSQVELDDEVSVTVSNVPLRKVLDDLLHPRQIRYRVHEKSGAITLKKSARIASSSATSNNAIVTSKSNEAIRVGGVVTDAATKLPMAGVNVIIKGTVIGTTTDAGGTFAMDADDDDVLVFSFIGYSTAEVSVNGRSTVDIEMNEDIRSLDAVVINAGYYETTRQQQTGNISRVDSKVIENQPVSNPLAALQGRMPGVYIQQTTGVPGGGFNIQIRGRNSIRSDGNSPLYIIDGVPFTAQSLTTASVIQGGNPLNGINPADIQSIEILKDADATSIYGSRGANGVVLITTKKSTGNKTEAMINVSTGVGSIANRMDLLNTRQYLEMRREAFSNDGVSMNNSNARELLLWDTTRYTDWQEKLIGGNSHVLNAQASVSGGNSNTNFLFGTGYYRESSVFPGSNHFSKTSGHLNLNHTSDNGKFSLMSSVSLVINDNDLIRADLTGSAINLAPNAPAIYDDQGQLNWENSTWTNPYSNLGKRYFAKGNNMVSNAVVSYRITEDLKVKTSIGYTSVTVKEIMTNPISSSNPAFGPTTGYSTFTTADLATWIAEPQLEYTKDMGGGKLSALVGTSFQQNSTQRQSIFADGFTNDALLRNMRAASALSMDSFEDVLYRYSAVFGRIAYAWRDKYMMNITARRDGSSRFGPGNKFANFGAIGAAWIISEEKFMSNHPLGLTFAKLRGSVGTSGNDQIGDYQYLDTYSSTSYAYDGTAGLIPTRLANPDYSWESNRKVEGAIEMGFLEDRIFFSTSVYRNTSSNQLVGYNLPLTTGFASIQNNLPAKIRNTGWEFELTTRIIESGNISWTNSVNLTVPRNKLVAYPGLTNSAYANLYAIGKPLSVQKKFHNTGVDPQTGVYTFEDVDENGSGTNYPADLQTRKTIAQQYFGGFRNTLSVGNFELDIFFQFVKQTGRNYIAGFGAPGRQGNQPDVVMNRWEQPGDATGIQRFTQSFSTPANAAYNSMQSYGDKTISDASFIRLKNVAFSYSLPSAWMQRIGIRKFQLYVQGQNLWTLTNYIGMDPEQQLVGVLPPLKMYTAGARLTF